MYCLAAYIQSKGNLHGSDSIWLAMDYVETCFFSKLFAASFPFSSSCAAVSFEAPISLKTIVTLRIKSRKIPFEICWFSHRRQHLNSPIVSADLSILNYCHCRLVFYSKVTFSLPGFRCNFVWWKNFPPNNREPSNIYIFIVSWWPYITLSPVSLEIVSMAFSSSRIRLRRSWSRDLFRVSK